MSDAQKIVDAARRFRDGYRAAYEYRDVPGMPPVEKAQAIKEGVAAKEELFRLLDQIDQEVQQ